jgi:hypothetical protein
MSGFALFNIAVLGIINRLFTFVQHGPYRKPKKGRTYRQQGNLVSLLTKIRGRGDKQTDSKVISQQRFYFLFEIRKVG